MPNSEDSPTIAFRVTPELKERIEDYTDDHSVHQSEALRELLRFALDAKSGEDDADANDTDDTGTGIPREFYAYTIGLMAAASAFSSTSPTVGYAGLLLAVGAWLWTNRGAARRRAGDEDGEDNGGNE